MFCICSVTCVSRFVFSVFGLAEDSTLVSSFVCDNIRMKCLVFFVTFGRKVILLKALLSSYCHLL
jgi:hypothetical protein